MKKVISAVFAAMMLPSLGIADDVVKGFEISGGGGDIKDIGTGYVIDVGYYANQKIRFRLGYASIDFDNHKGIGPVSFFEKFDQNNVRLTVDWFPWSRRNGFFVSAGAAHLGDPAQLSFEADAIPVLPLNNSFYTGTQIGTISGTVETNSVVPYVGLGYRYQFRRDKGWFVQAEAGRIFGLSPSLKLSSDNTSDLANLNADLQAFGNSQNDSLDDSYTVYGVTLGYLF
ncbi:hypothetical protein [Leucothrix arctica]|uniref:Outer membrane protein beta-barrel domain-containing protein n=1 Tax=Leucothrix arctica TaxID=1481894 RepID=A0A317CM73_9GAMM|nr:hypothetical protein [Leucothrix arctica]PWQ99626.1 hypothetical protein DKT75_00715 [Leucothrix arctica]